MRRILIISPCPDQGAGAEIVLEELLRAWRVEDLKLVLLTPEGSRIHRVALENGFEWHNLPVKKNGLHLRDNLRAVKSACAAIPPCDRIHAWTLRAFPSAEWLGRKWGVPVSGTLHDNPVARKIHGPVLWGMRGMDFQSPQAWKDLLWCTQELVLRTTWQWRWARKAANRFDRLISVSEAVRMECEKKGYRCRLSVIRNGLADMPVSERTPSETVRIGFLGMEYPHRKGFSIVERWIRTLQGNVIWKLYGNASKRTLKRIENFLPPASLEGLRGVQRKIFRQDEQERQDWNCKKSAPSAKSADRESSPNAYKLQTTASFLGHQSRETIFHDIDILVHTSTLFDPLPTVLIEAARAGIPCIASSNGGAGEIVEDGESGFLFDPHNPDEGMEKLRQLLDPALRRLLGKNARSIFEQRFSVERMVNEYAVAFSGTSVTL